MCQRKNVRLWSCVSWITTHSSSAGNLCKYVQKEQRDRKNEIGNCKAFALHVNAIIIHYLVNKLWASRLKIIEPLLFCLLALPNLAIDPKKSKVNLTFTLRLVTPETKQMFILLLSEFQVNYILKKYMRDPSERLQLVCFDIGKVNHVGLHWNSQEKK